MRLDQRDIAEKVAQADQADHPQQCARDVVHAELAAGHGRYTRHEGCEGAHKRHESCRHQGNAAVTFIEVMSLVESTLVEIARLFPLEHLGSEMAANRIVDLVSHDRRHDQQDHDQGVTHQPEATHGTDHKQQ